VGEGEACLVIEGDRSVEQCSVGGSIIKLLVADSIGRDNDKAFTMFAN